MIYKMSNEEKILRLWEDEKEIVYDENETEDCENIQDLTNIFNDDSFEYITEID